jgi:hypothetical protein
MKVVGILVLLAVAVLSPGVARADGDSFTFSTDPGSGTVSGDPGTTVGWGYSITNDSSTDWLVIIAVSTTQDFSDGTADSSIFDFPIIAPGQTDTTPFSIAGGTGLYQLAWNPDAPAGAINSGLFDLTGIFCSDASFDGCSDTTVDQFSPYQALITTSTTAPEPSSTVLLFAGLLIVFLGRAYFRNEPTN